MHCVYVNVGGGGVERGSGWVSDEETRETTAKCLPMTPERLLATTVAIFDVHTYFIFMGHSNSKLS